MADSSYSWPSREEASIIGKRHTRTDGLVKISGVAKYTYDMHRKNQLIVRALSSPHAHCRIKAIDTREAERVPGVVAVKILPHAEPGKEIRWEGELLVAVAGESIGAAVEGVSKIKAEYELLDVFTQDNSAEAAEKADRTSRPRTRVETEREPGDDDDEDEFADAEIRRLLSQAEYVVEGRYGIEAITHCCMEPHGATVRWEGDRLIVDLSTQNVSGTDDQVAAALKQAGMDVSADQVDVECQYLGGGFGSKFSADYWTIAAAQIAKETGRPVKFMLDRAQELKIAGNRPSGFIDVKLGADKNGVVTVWDSTHCGTSGPQGVRQLEQCALRLSSKELAGDTPFDQDEPGTLACLASSKQSAGLLADDARL